jgi:two-component system chemotaxis response regulator CheY
MSRTTVLVVDDAQFMRSMLRQVLENSGRYEVLAEASTGLEAVELAGRLHPQLVTMDIVMPEMDGIEATRRIVEADPSCRIVMCSSQSQESAVIDSIVAGARDFILKPFTPESVLGTLEAVLRTE